MRSRRRAPACPAARADSLRPSPHADGCRPTPASRPGPPDYVENWRDPMAGLDASLKEMMAIDGAIGAAVVDYNSGMALGFLGGDKDLDLQVAAAGNTEVVKAKLRTMDSLRLTDHIEDILITLGTQYHVIRPVSGRSGQGLFLYVALDRNRANLALARHRLKQIEERLEI
ncbi:hypothetical protein GCM10010106_03420 [Thermopolyspora flexuosa]|nr:hypothetical protein GCM10010106_03420 [Thermopolyspora flexuosa]